ncbi:MAG: PIN domain nuclease [Oscillospiraceae bacterium]|jgi:predicted nucleic acid-binding protein|nr:PIN domain nuclease [Oscillospiraceae bacterium]
MKRLKIYLDTSVISHLDQQDAPEKMAETRKLWERAKTGAFDVVLSNVDFEEILDCSPEKQAVLLEYLAQIQYERVEVNAETLRIADKMVDLGILKQKSYDDCQHIAAAIVSDCDAVISWNFKHIVNHKTMQGVKAVTALEGRSDLLIYTPPTLLGGEDNDE